MLHAAHLSSRLLLILHSALLGSRAGTSCIQDMWQWQWQTAANPAQRPAGLRPKLGPSVGSPDVENPRSQQLIAARLVPKPSFLYSVSMAITLMCALLLACWSTTNKTAIDLGYMNGIWLHGAQCTQVPLLTCMDCYWAEAQHQPSSASDLVLAACSMSHVHPPCFEPCGAEASTGVASTEPEALMVSMTNCPCCSSRPPIWPSSKQVARKTPWLRARMATWDSTSTGERVRTAVTFSWRYPALQSSESWHRSFMAQCLTLHHHGGSTVSSGT